METKVLSVDSTGNDSRDKNQESLQKRRNVTIEDTTENIQITRYSKTDGVKSALKAALLKCDLLKNVPDQTRLVPVLVYNPSALDRPAKARLISRPSAEVLERVSNRRALSCASSAD